MQNLSATARAGKGAKKQIKKTIYDFHDTYVNLIAKASKPKTKTNAGARTSEKSAAIEIANPAAVISNENDKENADTDVNLVTWFLDGAGNTNKSLAGANGNVDGNQGSEIVTNLNTSSFTVCARVRPLLPHDKSQQSGEFVATVARQAKTSSSSDSIKPKQNKPKITVYTPKVNFRGQPKLEPKSFDFDYVFGSESTNEELAALTVAPLVQRALNGQVGVIFAYGQTGSGKTHSMNGVMDHLLRSPLLFNDGISISFSYIEILGDYINDCLGPNDSLHSSQEMVSIGEMMDGRLVVRNIASHNVQTSAELSLLVKQAKSLQSTAATEKNSTSSRSHGIGIITCTDVATGIEGSLYIIDLAGSERSADTKGHDKERIAETKAINSSLSTLKDCIRARTMASKPGMGGSVHVPYRRSKLTLLMKDVFDAGCTRLCSTVVLATCSPLASDCSHSANTLKYSSPLCDNQGGSASGSGKAIKMQVDTADPVVWSNAQLLEWVTKMYPSLSDPSSFVGVLSGVQLCALPEKEYYFRVEQSGIVSSGSAKELAKDLYLAIWTLMSDAKTRKRKKDGSIITIEDEENERLRFVAETEERARIWAEREKHLKS